jgi:predicted DNA-binding protein
MNLKLTLQLSPDLRQRLGIESATTGKSNSAIVTNLIDTHLELPDDLEQFATNLKKTPSAPAVASEKTPSAPAAKAKAAKAKVANLEKTPSAPAAETDDAKTDDAKTDDCQGKNTSLYLPALTSMRLYFHMLETGEDRRSTVIRLIGEHISPWARYDTRTHGTYDRSTHHTQRFKDRSKSDEQANNSTGVAA